MRKALLVTLALVAVLAVAIPAQAVTENFTIRTTAPLTLGDPGPANFSGTNTCDGGTGTLTLEVFRAGVPVGQPHVTQVVCNGTTQEWSTTVAGPFFRDEIVTVRGTLVADGQTVVKTYKVKIT